jgi:pectate lyase
MDGIAIDNIVFTWGGDATDVTIIGLPASGIMFVKDISSKTITISGTPTTDVTYSVTTSGSSGTPVSISGSITVGTIITGDEIHNFTESGTTSTFYKITGNLSTSRGDANYNGLVLTQCLRMESSTNITFTTTQTSTLTLVLNDGYTGSLNINGVAINGISGIVTLQLPAGNHVIQRTSGVTNTNLYYISVEFVSLGLDDLETSELRIYPNPVQNNLYINSNIKIEKILIYNLMGKFVQTVEKDFETIDLSNLNSGQYLIKVETGQGFENKMIVKK